MYELDWLAIAVSKLAESWVNADSSLRDAITVACYRIDEALKSYPLDIGESRTRGRRIHFDSPVAVVYEVNVRLKIVTVVDAVVFEKHS